MGPVAYSGNLEITSRLGLIKIWPRVIPVILVASLTSSGVHIYLSISQFWRVPPPIVLTASWRPVLFFNRS